MKMQRRSHSLLSEWIEIARLNSAICSAVVSLFNEDKNHFYDFFVFVFLCLTYVQTCYHETND